MERAETDRMRQATNEILSKIAQLYDSYSQKAANMSADQRTRLADSTDSREKQAMQELERLSLTFQKLIPDMEKTAALKKEELKNSTPLAKQCYQDVNTILKKKSPLFKVGKNFEELIEQTSSSLEQIRKSLGVAGQTTFLCCGTDGVEAFKKVIQHFKVIAAQWMQLASLEPKGSVQTFVSPTYSANEFAFIREILDKLWPLNTVKEVEKKVYINTGKASRLVEANEYIYGINREANPYYGLEIYHEEANQGDAAAACYLGIIYEEGVLLPRDLIKSSKYYQKAITGKQSYAYYRYAMSLIEGELSDRGVNSEHLKKGFDLLSEVISGDNVVINIFIECPEALVELGSFYERGRFACDESGLYTTSKDMKKAIDYYQKARKLHLPRATNNLGVLYINNKNISESNPNSTIKNEDTTYGNLERGKKFLEEAEKFGFPQAHYNLGCLYENGVLENKNPQVALMEFYRGGLKGDLESRLKFVYQLMNQTSVMKEQYIDHYRLAHFWLDSIVHKTDLTLVNSPSGITRASRHTTAQKAEALYYLGLMYEYGFGVDKNAKQAFSYFRESSSFDYPAGKNKLGDCFFSGYGTQENRQQALECYMEAAAKNNSDAYVNLGTIYLNGIPRMVERDYNEAYNYFLKALELENSNAMIHLSYMYKNKLGGLHEKEDNPKEMAKKLLEEAAANRNPTALYMLNEMGGDYDERALSSNLDNDFFTVLRKLNLREVVPYLQNYKSS